MDARRELDDLRAVARERGGALVLYRRLDLEDGEERIAEPLMLYTQGESDGLLSLHFLDAESRRFEFVGDRDDLRRVLDEPTDLSQPE